MDFSVVGVLASLIGPSAQAVISVFAVSTFDTDYLLMKQAVWERAREVLKAVRSLHRSSDSAHYGSVLGGNSAP